MEIRFGNLSVGQFIEKTEAKISNSDIEWLNIHRIDNANFTESDKFHIFDLPFGILAGKDIAQELINLLKHYEFKGQFYVEGKS